MKEKYRISVGEPWDYENAQGKNIIIGQILKRINNRCIVFLSDIPLEFGSSIGNILVLSNRYTKDEFTEDLNKLNVNGGLLLEDFNDSWSEEELRNHSRGVIIGRLEKY